MSLLSLLMPALWVYFVGFRVLLEQLFRRLRQRSVSKPVLPLQSGRVAIVTGGIKGIGYHIAKELARLGMHVIIVANDEKKGHESVMEIKEEILNAKGLCKSFERTCTDSQEQLPKQLWSLEKYVVA